jgi:hypothetical protein
MFPGGRDVSQPISAIEEQLLPWNPGGKHLWVATTRSKWMKIGYHPFISGFNMFPSARIVPQPISVMEEQLPLWNPGGEHLRVDTTLNKWMKIGYYPCASEVPQPISAIEEQLSPQNPGGEHLQVATTWTKWVKITVYTFISGWNIFPGTRDTHMVANWYL